MCVLLCAQGTAAASNGRILRSGRLKIYGPVGQRSGKVALDVGVHDGFEMLEFAVLEEVDDVDLEVNREDVSSKAFFHMEDFFSLFLVSCRK